MAKLGYNNPIEASILASYKRQGTIFETFLKGVSPFFLGREDDVINHTSSKVQTIRKDTTKNFNILNLHAALGTMITRETLSNLPCPKRIHGERMIKTTFVSLLTLLLLPSVIFSETLRISLAIPENSPVFSKAQQVMNEIAEGTNLKIKINLAYMPNKRSYLNLESGKTDGDLGRIKEVYENSDNAVMVPEYILTSDYHVLAKRNIKIEGWQSLKPYTVIIQRGSRFSELKIQDNADDVHLSNNAESALRMLSVGRGDAYIAELLSITAICRKLDCNRMGIKILQPRIDFIPLYLFLHKNYQDLADPLAASIKTLKRSGRITEIFSSP